MASSINARIQKFISTHELDESINDELTVLVKKCIGELYDHVKDTPAHEKTKSTKGTKGNKDTKLENISDATSIEDLNSITKDILNDYCKENSLRVTGTKKEIIERVWRHTQGDSSDDDISPRSKEKTVKAKPEKHACSCKNAKGDMCSITGEDQINDKWYCWRHIKNIKAGSEDEAEEAETKPKKKKMSKKKATVVAEEPGSEED